MPPSLPAIDAPPAVALVMVDRFANGDPANDLPGTRVADPVAFAGGDLAGVRQHLDHLRAMGITTVWLTPIFEMQTEPFAGHGAFHGYWVTDLGNLAPQFGGERDLGLLRDELHRRGMALWLDVVWNHVGYTAALRREHPGWFHQRGTIRDWNDPIDLENGEVHGLPDLDQANPEVFSYLLENTTRWLPYADGLRVDAVRHMPLDAQARLVDALRRRADAPLRVVGEVFDGDPTRLETARIQAHFDGVFDFPMHYALVDVACRGASPAHLAALLTSGETPAENLYTFLDNHDTPRITAECHGDRARVADAYRLLAHIRGTPVIPWASEAAPDGATEPDNRPMMDWKAPMPLLEPIRTALAERKQHPALVNGDTRIAYLDARVVVFTRGNDQETVYVAWNSGGTARWGDHDLRPGLTTWVGPPIAKLHPGISQVTLRIAGLPSDLAPRITGTGRRLGGWVPENGVPTVWRNGAWETSFDVPVGTVIEWKPVFPGASPRWPDGANAVLWVRGDREDASYAW